MMIEVSEYQMHFCILIFQKTDSQYDREFGPFSVYSEFHKTPTS